MSQKVYPVGIVGEKSYQPAVRATEVGDYVDLVIETGNPHAKSVAALRVDNMDGNTIGYIPEDHWLFRVIVDEGKGCLAKVKAKEGRPLGIVLDVRLGDEEIARLPYGEKLPQSQPGGCLGTIAALAIFAGYFLQGLAA